MKKIRSCFISLLMLLILVGCSSNNNKESVSILCPTGAPGLAFVSQYEDIQKEGSIDFVDGSDQLLANLTKGDSTYDIIVAPINIGCNLMAQDKTQYRLASILTWGNLYYVGTSEDALNQTGELALFGQGAVPEKIVNTVNIPTNLTPTYYSSASLVQQELLSGKASVGLLAEPLASATVAKAKQNNINLSIIKDLQKEYSKDGYPQAAIFIKDSLDNYENIFDKLDNFTNNDYPDLDKLVNKVTAKKLGLPSEEIAIKTIERQNIHYTKASECKDEISDFLNLFDLEFNDKMLAS